MFDRVHLAQPQWLWLLLLLPLLFWLQARAGRSAALRLPSLAPLNDQLDSPRQSSRWLPGLPWRRLLLVLPALALLMLALARPQRDEGYTTFQFSGIDMMLTVDVSPSMAETDFTDQRQRRTDRLSAVKEVLEQFIQARANDRLGLLAFAGNPYLVTPLTSDHELLARRLETEVRMGRVEDGTAIGTAIAASLNHLRDSDAKSKIIVLLTDGVNNAGEANPRTVAEAAKALGIKIYAIGAGSNEPAPSGGLIDQLLGDQGQNPIDEEMLQAIADSTGGRYFRATDTDTLEKIYQTINQLEKTERNEQRFDQQTELFIWPLALGALLLLGSTLLDETRFRSLP